MTNSVLDREDAPKHFPKSNLHQKKVMVTVWSSLASLIHYSFLNPGKIITSEKYAQQIDEIHQKLQHLQLASIKRKGTILLDNTWPHITQIRLQKWTNWAMKFCHIHTYLNSWQVTTSSSNILITFCRENASTTTRRQKKLSKSWSNPKAWMFWFSSVQSVS